MGSRRRSPTGRHRLSREERVRVGGRRPGLRLVLPSPRLTPAKLRLIGGMGGVVIVVAVLARLLGSGSVIVPVGGGPDQEEILRWQEAVEGATMQRILELGMRESWVHLHPPGSPEGDSLLTVIEFRVPGDLHIEVLNLVLTKAVEESGGDIVRGVELNDARVELDVAYKGSRTHRFILQRYSGYRREAGLISIIIDDFGATAQEILVQFADLDFQWTATVIPGHPYSHNQARYLASRGIPVLVHMPMEPEAVDEWELGEGAIYADTPEEEVDSLVEEAVDEIAVAQGLSNHMGSRATTEQSVMRALMASLKARNLYFIDSYTTAASVAASEADRAGVLWARRNVFLDPEDDTGVIEEQFRRSLDLARQNGSVIMIGHPRVRTLEALRRWIPRAREAGFEFVTVDRLLRRSGR